MNKVHIDTEELQDAAGKFSSIAAEMRDMVGTIQREVDELDGWTDGAAEQFAETATTVRKTLESNINIFEKLAAFLRQYAEAQAAVETELHNNVNNL